MLDKFYVASFPYNGNLNFPVLMAERHRKKFIEFLDDLTDPKHESPLLTDDSFVIGGDRFQISLLKQSLIDAECNEFFIGACVRLEIGYNSRFGLEESHGVMLINPLLVNMQNALNFSMSRTCSRMDHEYYLKNIAYKYPPEFFTFSKEDISKLAIISQIGINKRNP